MMASYYWRVQIFAGMVDGKPSWEAAHARRYRSEDAAAKERDRLMAKHQQRVFRVVKRKRP